MANKLEPLDIGWKMKESRGFDNAHHALFRCDEFGLQKETITNKNKASGIFGTPKNYYYIDKCAKEMTDIQDLCDTWNELKDFDNPNCEIVWEKKIVPTIKLREGAKKNIPNY